MDLHINPEPSFTRWLVARGHLRKPFVVVDVGVQGGESGRWSVLGDHLVIHGFDAIAAEVEKLAASNRGRTNLHYHWLAIGNEDGERTFYVNDANPTSSSFHRPGAGRFESGWREGEREQRVPIRRLDTLLREGTIPRADFLKIDVEGFEKDVLEGARELLAAGMLGVECETSMNVSETYPRGHFAAMNEILVQHHLLPFDLAFDRVPRATFRNALAEAGKALRDDFSIGRVATINALFARDLVEEADRPLHHLPAPAPHDEDDILKLMILFELHGLNDVALDTAVRFSDRLAGRIDVAHAVQLLADPACGTRIDALAELRRRVEAMEASTSWRVTAPLRAVSRVLKR